MQLKELSRSLREGPFTSLGSYPKFWMTADQGVLSFDAIVENLWLVYRATRDYNQNVITQEVKQWAITAVQVNWEDPDLYCDHTGNRIESAHAEGWGLPSDNG